MPLACYMVSGVTVLPLVLQAVVKLPFAEVKSLATAAQQPDPDGQEIGQRDHVSWLALQLLQSPCMSYLLSGMCSSAAPVVSMRVKLIVCTPFRWPCLTRPEFSALQERNKFHGGMLLMHSDHPGAGLATAVGTGALSREEVALQAQEVINKARNPRGIASAQALPGHGSDAEQEAEPTGEEKGW